MLETLTPPAHSYVYHAWLSHPRRHNCARLDLDEDILTMEECPPPQREGVTGHVYAARWSVVL